MLVATDPNIESPAVREVRIVVSGPVGCGKSALLEEINIALTAIGVSTRFADPAAVRSERNMVSDPTDLEPFRDRIVCVLSESVS